MSNNTEACFRINGKLYTIDEASAIHRFYEDCVDRGSVDQALNDALFELARDNPAIVEFGKSHFEKVYEECLKRLPLWKREREDLLNEAEWAYKDLAAIAVRDMYERKEA
jgi:hypothetical protein